MARSQGAHQPWPPAVRRPTVRRLVWALTGDGFFWPAFPIAGWGIGLAFHAWDAYGRVGFTEGKVRREMDHLRAS